MRWVAFARLLSIVPVYRLRCIYIGVWRIFSLWPPHVTHAHRGPPSRRRLFLCILRVFIQLICQRGATPITHVVARAFDRSAAKCAHFFIFFWVKSRAAAYHHHHHRSPSSTLLLYIGCLGVRRGKRCFVFNRQCGLRSVHEIKITTHCDTVTPYCMLWLWCPLDAYGRSEEDDFR